MIRNALQRGIDIVNGLAYKGIVVATKLADKNPFDELHGKMNVESNESEFKGMASSFYILMTVIGIIGLAGTIIFCGIKLAASKNSSDRAEIKKQLMFKSAIAIVLFAFPFFVGIYHNIIYIISMN